MTILKARPKVIVFSLDQESYACPVIRILTPLRLAGWDVFWGVKQSRSGFTYDLDAARDADLIIIQRYFPAEITYPALRAISNLNIPIVYDLDDAFLEIPASHPHYKNLSAHIPYIKWMLKEADLITVSTPLLQESLKARTNRPINVLPNLLDWTLFDSPPASRNGVFNILISGTPTHQEDWSLIEDPLEAFLNSHKGQVNAVFFGELPKRFSGHPSARTIGFQRDYAEYARLLRELTIHAALIPLQDTQFNRCKSNIKWLEYSAAGIPGAYSKLQPYISSIKNEETGLLVDNSHESWFRAMERLFTDQGTAMAMVESSRREVREHYSVDVLSHEYAATHKTMIDQHHKRNSLADISILPTRIKARARQNLNGASRWVDTHILWRFNKDR